MKKIHIKLKDLRKSKDLTQQELASKLGVSRQSIIAVEAGKFLPSIELAWEIANFFDLAIEDLFRADCNNTLIHRNYENNNKEEDTMPRDFRELTPWEHMHGIRPFRDAMDRLVEDFFGEEAPQEVVFAPRVDINQKDNKVIVKCEVPGIGPDDIEVSIKEDYLTIEGQKKSEFEEKGNEWYKREINYGKFFRTIPLPQPVKAEVAQAKFKNGTLTIEVPIEEPKKIEGKKIKIEQEKE